MIRHDQQQQSSDDEPLDFSTRHKVAEMDESDSEVLDLSHYSSRKSPSLLIASNDEQPLDLSSRKHDSSVSITCGPPAVVGASKRRKQAEPKKLHGSSGLETHGPAVNIGGLSQAPLIGRSDARSFGSKVLPPQPRSSQLRRPPSITQTLSSSQPAAAAAPVVQPPSSPLNIRPSLAMQMRQQQFRSQRQFTPVSLAAKTVPPFTGTVVSSRSRPPKDRQDTAGKVQRAGLFAPQLARPCPQKTSRVNGTPGGPGVTLAQATVAGRPIARPLFESTNGRSENDRQKTASQNGRIAAGGKEVADRSIGRGMNQFQLIRDTMDLDYENTERKRKNYKSLSREKRVEANLRERERVHEIGAAFNELRECLPCVAPDHKLSKLAILRIAATYIIVMGKMVGIDYSEDAKDMSLQECIELCRWTILEEGRPKRPVKYANGSGGAVSDLSLEEDAESAEMGIVVRYKEALLNGTSIRSVAAATDQLPISYSNLTPDELKEVIMPQRKLDQWFGVDSPALDQRLVAEINRTAVKPPAMLSSIGPPSLTPEPSVPEKSPCPQSPEIPIVYPNSPQEICGEELTHTSPKPSLARPSFRSLIKKDQPKAKSMSSMANSNQPSQPSVALRKPLPNPPRHRTSGLPSSKPDHLRRDSNSPVRLVIVDDAKALSSVSSVSPVAPTSSPQTSPVSPRSARYKLRQAQIEMSRSIAVA